MKYWGLIFTFLFINTAFAQRSKLPVIHGKIQLHANCIQCGGRFLCGHTDEVTTLSYNRKNLRQSIKAHCAQKSNDISEALRIKGSATSEEELRYQKYHEDILLSIDANKGGRLKYKEEKGFAYSDFFRYLQPTKNLSSEERKRVIDQNKQQVGILKQDNTLLPVLSIQDFKDTRGELIRPGRLEAEYQNYVKDLMVAHPSYLFEEPKNSGLYIKSLSQNAALQERLAKKFDLGGRNVASLGGGSGSTYGKSSSGGGSDEDQGEGVSNSSPEDQVIYDQNGKNITAEVKAKERKKERIKAQRESDAARIEKERSKGGIQQKQLSMYKSGDASKIYWNDTSFGATAKAIMGTNPSTDICNGNNTDQTNRKIGQYSNTITQAGGASDGYTSDAQFNELTESLIQATRLGSEACRQRVDTEVLRVFGSNGDKKTAQQLVAELDNTSAVRRDSNKSFVDSPEVRMVASNTNPTPPSSLAGSTENPLEIDLNTPVLDDNPDRAANAGMLVALTQENTQRIASKGIKNENSKTKQDPKETVEIDSSDLGYSDTGSYSPPITTASHSFDCSNWDLVASKIAYRSMKCEADLASACNKKISDSFYENCLQIIPDVLASEFREVNLRMCRQIISPKALEAFNFDFDYQPGKKIKDKSIYELSSNINTYMPVRNAMLGKEKKLKLIAQIAERNFGFSLGRHGLIDLEIKPPAKFCEKINKTVFKDGKLISSGFNLMEERTIAFFYSHESDNEKDKNEKAFLYRFFAAGQGFNEPQISKDEMCKKIHERFHSLAINSLNKNKIDKQLMQAAKALQANLTELAKKEELPPEILELDMENLKNKSPVYAELIRQGAILKYYTPESSDYALPRLSNYTEACSEAIERAPADTSQAVN
ncbi:MAG: hypothetical protein VX642_13260 [Bdellovibrionota bacterium]|nr:hypothetical protein [Bdellovibrionota bacterium]